MVILLLVANAATIATFWVTRKNNPPAPKGSPADFLSKELNLDANQKVQLEKLVKEHREAAESLRPKVREAKDAFFDLMKNPTISDSSKKAAAQNVSAITEQLDLLTFDHFQKIRAICNVEQQKKFDAIIHQVTAMMAPPPGGPGPGDHHGPPPGGPGGDHPPQHP